MRFPDVFLGVLVAVSLAAPRAQAQPSEALAPVRAFGSGHELLVITQASWMTAELCFPGQQLAPVSLGPSFPGARWHLEEGGDGATLELAWVSPGGAGVTLSLPIERSATLFAPPADGGAASVGPTASFTAGQERLP